MAPSTDANDVDLEVKRCGWSCCPESPHKNLVIISLGFLVLFSSYMSAQNIQSSINSDEGLGVASLSVIYGALILGCLFLPNATIKILGLKKTIVCSMFVYTFYFLANFYPSFYTMIPTSVILGLGGSTLWPAKCSYLSELSRWKGKDRSQSPQRLSAYFGVFFGIFQCAHVIGNVISYALLKPAADNEETAPSNGSVLCGSMFCDSQWSWNSSQQIRPSVSQVRLLFGVYTGGCLLAVLLLLVGLDNVPEEQPETEPLRHLLSKAVRHLRDPRQLLMIPLTIFSGFEQAFIFSDFTKAFVTCSWGVHNVGYVMICFGVCNAASCFALSAYISRKVARHVLITCASLLDIVCILIMLLIPNLEMAHLFVIAGVWGAADAVWQSQINTHYGVLFVESRREGFAHYRLWESVGFIVAFTYSPHLCILVQLYILLCSLAVGFFCYLPTSGLKCKWTL